MSSEKDDRDAETNKNMWRMFENQTSSPENMYEADSCDFMCPDGVSHNMLTYFLEIVT